MFSNKIELFQQLFHQEPLIQASAPGRINLIGEHTDYNDGYVLPAAVHLRTHCLMAPRQDNKVHVFSENFSQSATFDLKNLKPGQEKGWWKYIQGIFWVLMERGEELTGANLLFWGDLPLEAGLSSSASLEISLLKALLTWLRSELPPEEIARLGQKAENEFVGVRCGLMDQFIAVLARQAHALFLDCEKLKYEYVPLPLEEQGLVILVYDTRVPRQLASSGYNQRRAEAQKAREALAREGFLSFRQVTPEQLEEIKDSMDPVIYRRARHVIRENDRVLRAKEALKNGHFHLLGQLLFASHFSLRDDYEVSCPELDLFVEIASRFPGCLGARLVGAGFGGSAIALVKKERVAELVATSTHQAAQKGYPSPQTFVLASGFGATASWLKEKEVGFA